MSELVEGAAADGAAARANGAGPANGAGAADAAGAAAVAALAAGIGEEDGLTFLRRIAAGEMPPPPIATLLGMWVERVDPGEVTFLLEPGPRHYNPIGTVHGGIAATLLDSAMGCAVQSRLPAGVGYTTLDLSVKYVRAITAATGTVACHGTVVHLGGRTATAEARLVARETGALLAHGTSSLLVLRPGR